MMKAVLLSWALAVGFVQAAPVAGCLCRPGCNGEEMPSSPESRGCCEEEAPPPSQPCPCFHRSDPDPGTLELTSPPSISPATLEAPAVDLNPFIPLGTTSDPIFWRASLPRGAPLYLLNSVLLI